MIESLLFSRGALKVWFSLASRTLRNNFEITFFLCKGRGRDWPVPEGRLQSAENNHDQTLFNKWGQDQWNLDS
jgi:hypothetical protein